MKQIISALTIIKTIKIKNFFQNSFKSYKISNFNFLFLGSVVLYMLTTIACSEEHNLGLVRHRHINNISCKS